MAEPLVEIVDVLIAAVDGLYQDKMGLIANVETLREACHRYLAHQPQPVAQAVAGRLALLEDALREEQQRSDYAAAIISQMRADLQQCHTELVGEKARHLPARRRIRLRQLASD